jgi:hypothetical protein
MRADETEILFREWLLQIGNAKNARGNQSASPLNIPDGQLAKNLEELITFCFPHQFFLQPFKYYCKIIYGFKYRIFFYFKLLFVNRLFFAL